MTSTLTIGKRPTHQGRLAWRFRWTSRTSSTARDGAREDSDLDILVEFDVGPTFDSYFGLKFFLEDHLSRKVDLVTPDALKPRMRPVVEREAVEVA